MFKLIRRKSVKSYSSSEPNNLNLVHLPFDQNGKADVRLTLRRDSLLIDSNQKSTRRVADLSPAPTPFIEELEPEPCNEHRAIDIANGIQRLLQEHEDRLKHALEDSGRSVAKLRETSTAPSSVDHTPVPINYGSKHKSPRSPRSLWKEDKDFCDEECVSMSLTEAASYGRSILGNNLTPQIQIGKQIDISANGDGISVMSEITTEGTARHMKTLRVSCANPPSLIGNGRANPPPPPRRRNENYIKVPPPPPPYCRRLSRKITSTVSNSSGLSTLSPPPPPPPPPPRRKVNARLPVPPPPPLERVTSKSYIAPEKAPASFADSCPIIFPDEFSRDNDVTRTRPHFPSTPPQCKPTTGRRQPVIKPPLSSRKANKIDKPSLSMSCPDNLPYDPGNDFDAFDAERLSRRSRNPLPPPSFASNPKRLDDSSASKSTNKSYKPPEGEKGFQDKLSNSSKSRRSSSNESNEDPCSPKEKEETHNINSRIRGRASSRPKFNRYGRCAKHPSIIVARKKVFGKGWNMGRGGCQRCNEAKAKDVSKSDRSSSKNDSSTTDDEIRGTRSGTEPGFQSRRSPLEREQDLKDPTSAMVKHDSKSDNVANMPYTTPWVKSGWYSGEISNDGVPHGSGRMRFRGGDQYGGNWINGFSEECIENKRRMERGFSKNCSPWNEDKKVAAGKRQ